MGIWRSNVNIAVEYTGSGYRDPATSLRMVPSCRMTIAVEGMPSTLPIDKVEEWLRMELATICSILMSYTMRPIYNIVVGINVRYRAAIYNAAFMADAPIV